MREAQDTGLPTFKTSVGLAMLEDMTPERIPQTTFIRRVSSAKTHYLTFHIYRTLHVSNAYTNEIHVYTTCSLNKEIYA